MGALVVVVFFFVVVAFFFVVGDFFFVAVVVATVASVVVAVAVSVTKTILTEVAVLVPFSFAGTEHAVMATDKPIANAVKENFLIFFLSLK